MQHGLLVNFACTMQAEAMVQPFALGLRGHLTHEDAASNAAIAATLAQLREAATPMARSGTLICLLSPSALQHES
jgi:hypothetical protein